MSTLKARVARRRRSRDWDDHGVESDALARELGRTVEGEVRFDDGSRALYATDGSNYRQVPIGVVVPKSLDDVVATHAACRGFGAPILARGCGTSLSGEAVNVAVVMDLSKYLHRILDIDPAAKLARVQPGVIHDQLTDETLEHGLVFAPDPATHAYCTIGGNIGNNSCGTHSVQGRLLGEGGRTSDNVHELEVLTYDGTRMRVGETSDEELERIVAAGGRRGQMYAELRALRDKYAGLIRRRFPDIPRRVSGYNLDELLPEKGFNVARALVGTEGTCVTVLEATVSLVDDPPARVLVVIGYRDVFEAGDSVPAVMARGPLACEGIDKKLVDNQRAIGMHPGSLSALPDGGGWLFVEIGGDHEDECKAEAEALLGELRGSDPEPVDARILGGEQIEPMWQVRESALGATAFPPNEDRDYFEGWEDSAVPPERVGAYLRDLRRLYDEYDYDGSLYGHFGQGCIHTRICFDFETRQGIERYRSFIYDAADLCLSHGGSLSGEHGDGQSRAELLPKMYGEELVEAFREFKRIWDPDWKMNPGKVVDPRRLDQDLKLAPDNWGPPEVDTHFSYPEDRGSFPHSTVRCVGVGKCRSFEGTMCPSFMVTREEKHTTRGRARMLFEMLQGDPVGDGWRDDDVKDSLDLCLSCKGCKGDCPVSVDMATYKAEFLSHYYRGRLRPRAAYSMGLIFVWARVASRVPHLANLVTRAPVLSDLLKRAGGVTTERAAPAFAERTFRDWFAGRERVNAGGPKVLLWPDTFNNYFHPEVARASVEVLESAGYEVEIPARILCCGRPLYDYGMLEVARWLLRQTLRTLRPQIEQGTPVVGMEPSCTAVFRDELTNLLPHDEDAGRLSQQCFTLGEFLQKGGHEPPKLDAGVLVHPHCHQGAVMGMNAERTLLSRMGAEVEMTDAGCCGLAGSFGFEEGERYEVSIAVGERKLAPMVRDAGDDTVVVADGFSCRTQLEHLTGRRAVHTAELIRGAMDGPRRQTG
ncbi:MAG: FAD-binding and (Fe-S)-binding domain-containing protein, partial [Actinomycetota bacterium]